jgi:hypothetical protein
MAHFRDGLERRVGRKVSRSTCFMQNHSKKKSFNCVRGDLTQSGEKLVLLAGSLAQSDTPQTFRICILIKAPEIPSSAKLNVIA